MKLEEEAAFEAQVDAYQREQDARRAQEEDNATLARAMAQTPAKCRRLQLDIHATAATGTRTSTRMHLPLPADDTPTVLSFEMKVIEAEVKSDGLLNEETAHQEGEADGASLMQSAFHFKKLQEVQFFLRDLPYQLRRGILQGLLERVQEELHGSLRLGVHFARLVQLFTEALEGLPENEPDAEDPHSMLPDSLIVPIVELLLGHAREAAVLKHDDAATLLRQLRDLLLQPADDDRRRRTATASAAPLLVAGTTDKVHGVVTDVETAFNNLLNNVHVEQRMETRREAILTCEEIQIVASRLRALLVLISRHLPQPRSEPHPHAQ